MELKDGKKYKEKDLELKIECVSIHHSKLNIFSVTVYKF